MSIKSEAYQGVVVPMVTPLTKNGQIDVKSAIKLIDFLFDNETIPFILGTTGEAASIPSKERHRLIQILIDTKRNGTPAITGMIGLTVPDTIAEANKFLKKGIDAIVVTLPYHYELTDTQIYNYYRDLADQIEGDIILYNIPKTVNQSIPINIIEELSYQKNIIGIKDSELDEERLAQSLNLWKDRKDFFHFTGVNALMPEGLNLGSKGIVPATANFVPHHYVSLYTASKERKMDKVEKIFHQTVKYSELYQKGRTLGESLAALKFIMSEMDLCPFHVMPPITDLEESEKIGISNFIEKDGLKKN